MAAVSRSVASLRISGDALQVADISRALGREPSVAYEKGQRFQVSGRDHARKTGMWMIRTENSEPEALDAQISELLASVSNDLSTWRSLGAVHRIDVFCGLFLTEGNEGFSLEPVTLAALADRGIQIGFDIYGPSVNDNDGELPV